MHGHALRLLRHRPARRSGSRLSSSRSMIGARGPRDARPLGVCALAVRVRQSSPSCSRRSRRATLLARPGRARRPPRSTRPGRARPLRLMGLLLIGLGRAPDRDQPRRDDPRAAGAGDDRRAPAAVRVVGLRSGRGGAARARTARGARAHPSPARAEEPRLVRLVHRRPTVACCTGTGGCSARRSSHVTLVPVLGAAAEIVAAFRRGPLAPRRARALALVGDGCARSLSCRAPTR